MSDLKVLSTAELLAELESRKNDTQQNRQAYKDLVAEEVPKAIFELCVLSEQLSQAKQKVFQRFKNILELKKEAFKIKEKQRSHTFAAPNGEITIGYRINDGWDDSHTAGIEKVKNAIQKLAKDENSAMLVEGIFDLLKKDAKGNLKGQRVLELQKLADKIKDPELTDGVDIISKAYKPARSSWYVEASLTKDGGEKANIPLAMSSVDFPAGYSFNFFNEETIHNERTN